MTGSATASVGVNRLIQRSAGDTISRLIRVPVLASSAPGSSPEAISRRVVHPLWDTRGVWEFENAAFDFRFLHEAYSATDPDYTGKTTVPVLWDSRTHQIVSNESLDIAWMLNDLFNQIGGDPDVNLYPLTLGADIDDLRYARSCAKGVYAVGQATSQAAYERAMEELFGFLDEAEHRMMDERLYLLGARLTLTTF